MATLEVVVDNGLSQQEVDPPKDSIPSPNGPVQQHTTATDSLPKPEGVHQWCNGTRVKIDTHNAIKVNVKINILEISSIDQVSETFTAIFTMQLFHIDPMLKDFRTDVTYATDRELVVEENCTITTNWKYSPQGTVTIRCANGFEKELEPTCIQHIGQPDWDKDHTLFKPSFTFGNAVGTAEVIQHVRMLEYCSPAGGHVFEKYKFQATFAERLELMSMPFDRQVLRIRIYGEEPIWRMQLAPFKDDRAGWKSAPVPTEWKVDCDVDVCNQKVPPFRVMVWKLDDKAFRSSLEVVTHVKRIPTFYVLNVMVVNCAITFLTVAAYACRPDDFNGRAEIQFTLLLTSVSYKVVTSSWMPIKSYLTFLDQYILANLLIQAISIAESFISILVGCKQIRDQDDVWNDGMFNGKYQERVPPERQCWPGLDTFERYFCGMLYSVWATLHVLFYVSHYYGWSEKRLLTTWTDVYRAKNMIGDILTHCDQHPYGSSAEL
mmetsp:Transcript_15524/g.41116  ORF Transcript_15524/g.41116 Transcript_15524/m.41116 type:complete len:491 (-) Transcript_15524:234-1706(-)